MAFPSSSEYAVIGSGIHRLSTAYHLARDSKAVNRDGGQEINLIANAAIGARASQSFWGVLSLNVQPVVCEIITHRVCVWESEGQAGSYYTVGSPQKVPDRMRDDAPAIGEQLRGTDYESAFVTEGEKVSRECTTNKLRVRRGRGFISESYKNWGCYGHNTARFNDSGDKVEVHAERRISGVDVGEFQSVNGSDRAITDNASDLRKTNDEAFTPLEHVDTVAPLIFDINDSISREEMWGIYHKPGFNSGGVQDGGVPIKIRTRRDRVNMDPHELQSADWVVDTGAFNPGNFPLIDVYGENCDMIADSNHG